MTPRTATSTGEPACDLGDLVVVLLSSTLAGLRDRLAADGFADAAELVADLVDVADGYISGLERRREEAACEPTPGA